MKPLYWLVIDQKKITNTVWEKVKLYIINIIIV